MGEQGVVRMNVSVPRGLKERMDAIEESVNWSGVATQAFEGKLLELQSQRKAGTMEEVIDRLKAAGALEANEDYQDGFEAGQQWAKDIAKPKELRRAAEFVEMMENEALDWWDPDFSGLVTPFSVTDRFVFAVWPKRNEEKDAPDEFWQKALDNAKDRIRDSEFLHGFAEGAVEVWNQVCDKI